MAEIESEKTRFAQLSVMQPSQLAEELVTKTIRHKDVYKKYAPNEAFIRDLEASISHGTREYRGFKKKANLYNISVYTACSLRLQGLDLASEKPSL